MIGFGFHRKSFFTGFSVNYWKCSFSSIFSGKTSPSECAFDSWLMKKVKTGNVWIHDGINVRKGASGYELFANKNISASENILFVSLPQFSAESALLDCEKSNPAFFKSICSVIKSVAPSASSTQQNNLLSSTCLALQILINSGGEGEQQEGGGGNPDLKPYLNLLNSNSFPHNRHVLPHPICMDSSSSGSLAWLDRTSLHHAIHIRKRLYNAISEQLLGANMKLTRFDYAIGVILSRALSGELDGSPEGKVAPLTLVPVLDFCNHAADANAVHTFETMDKKDTFQLKALRDIREGEEITISYGNRDSVNFISVYGFCPRDSRFESQLFSFNIADHLNLHLEFSTTPHILANANGDRVNGSIPQVVQINIPIVELFLPEMASLADLTVTPSKRIELFDEVLGPWIQHIDPTKLDSLLKDEQYKMKQTRFWRREKGEYLCKSVAEERFVDDCQFYVEKQTQALTTLRKAVLGYLHALEEISRSGQAGAQ